MTFLRPDLAPWALLVPFIVLCWTLRRQVRAAFRRRFPIAGRFALLSRRTTTARDLLVLGAGVLAASAIAVALMRPQASLVRRVPEYEHKDLIILLDRSISMRARDIEPSRSARATQEIRNVLRQKPDGIDRVALVGFADAAVVLSYLTDDVESLLFYFDWIDADPTPLFGTNIGAALTSGMEVARKDDRPTPKIFLLVSDGEDYGTSLDHAVAAARARGYRVNCVGIGSDHAASIPVRGDTGQETPLRDDDGRPVTTLFGGATLQRIAAGTGGEYLRSATGDEVRRAIASMAGGGRRLVGWRASTERRELYPLFLGVAVFAGAVLWVAR
jgi:Mg-chelatase subunit ChlD